MYIHINFYSIKFRFLAYVFLALAYNLPAVLSSQLSKHISTRTANDIPIKTI